MVGFPPLVKRLPRSSTAISVIRVRYLRWPRHLAGGASPHHGGGFVMAEVATQAVGAGQDTMLAREASLEEQAPLVEVSLQIHGRGSVEQLAAELSEMAGVEAVSAGDPHNAGE